jgi:hypothetical protein
MLNFLRDTKLCLHNKVHTKNKDYCETCANNLKEPAVEITSDHIPVEFRALFLAIISEITEDKETKCWRIKNINKSKIKGYAIKNIIYAFYKGDIGNKVLKNTCGFKDCLNPAHIKSRFEPDQITKRVRVGFSRKYVKISDLTDDQWLRY